MNLSKPSRSNVAMPTFRLHVKSGNDRSKTLKLVHQGTLITIMRSPKEWRKACFVRRPGGHNLRRDDGSHQTLIPASLNSVVVRTDSRMANALARL